ncbi:lipoprotein [Alcaligenaceae bacterium]|nr:lipoprotein [Alcaligenaceae bacterium]
MPKCLDTHCKTAFRLLAGLSLAAMLTACGYKGPLYMPPPAPDASLTTPPTSTTLPDSEAAVEAGGPPSAATGAIQ